MARSVLLIGHLNDGINPQHDEVSDLHGEDVEDPVLLSDSPLGPPLPLVLVPGQQKSINRT